MSPPVQVPESTIAISVLRVPSNAGTLMWLFSTLLDPPATTRLSSISIAVSSQKCFLNGARRCVASWGFPLGIVPWSPLATVCVHGLPFHP